MKTKEKMETYFELVPDFRRKTHITYKLSDILFIFVCGLLCGLTSYEAISDLAEMRWDFFKKYISNKRPPCENTLRTVFGSLNPERLELCLIGIFRNVFCIDIPKKERQIAIDGKVICGEKAIHIVTAMVTDEWLSLGQVIVEKKSNEIPAVQELLDILNINGDVITFDAMHAQKDTLEKVIEKKGDYVVQVKRNQKTFYEDIEGLFALGKAAETWRTTEKGHGRREVRICSVLPDEFVDKDYFEGWAGIKKIFKVERQVEKDGKTTNETSYYISSKKGSAEKLLSYTRKHWQIESMHWVLDKVLGEDGSFLRDENAQDCMNRMRKFAACVMKKYIEQVKPRKKSIAGNMRLCLLSADHLEKVLNFFLFSFILQFYYV